MGYIGNEPTTGHFPVDNFTSSGGSTYTLSQAPASAGAIEVSVQGVLQPTTAYTVSGTTLTMAGVTSGVKIFVRHLGETLVLPTPADGSVTTAKLGINSVDGTKIAMGSDAQGDILYHGATDYARLAKGTASQQLRMNSGATAPEWATISTPAGGKVLQVVATNKTDTYSISVASIGTSSANVTGLEAAITPSATTSKILVSGHILLSSSNPDANSSVDVQLIRDGSIVADANGATAGSRVRVLGSGAFSTTYEAQSVGWSFLDSNTPADTSTAITYGIRLHNNRGATSILYVNRNGSDTDTAGNMRGASSIIAWEIGA